MAEPPMPQGVRAVMQDGREIPLECVYDGVRDGKHLWVTTWIVREVPRRVLVRVLPQNTSIAMVVTRYAVPDSVVGTLRSTDIVAAALGHGGTAASPAPGRGGHPDGSGTPRPRGSEPGE